MRREKPRMLVLSPHPDDGILGAGGTMARFAETGGQVTVLVLSAHRPPLRPESVCRRAVEEARHAYDSIGTRNVHFLDNEALSLSRMPREQISNAIATEIEALHPQVLIVPYFDRHMDHRAVFEASLVASRPMAGGCAPRLLAAYEVLSSTHWNAPGIEPCFTPNWLVDISDVINSKLKAFKCCRTENRKCPHPRSTGVIRALAKFRGSQVGFSYAEGFHIVYTTCGPEVMAQGGPAKSPGR